MSPMSPLPFDEPPTPGPHQRKFQIIGLIMVALGVLAVFFPLVASIAIKVMLGWFLLFAGAVQLSLAFSARDWRSALPNAAIALLYLAGGVWLAFFPLTGLIGLTLLLGIVFLLEGIAKAVIASQHRPAEGWVWLGLSGMASVILGALLIGGLPGTALWALGLMLGINLIASGAGFLALARM